MKAQLIIGDNNSQVVEFDSISEFEDILYQLRTDEPISWLSDDIDTCGVCGYFFADLDELYCSLECEKEANNY